MVIFSGKRDYLGAVKKVVMNFGWAAALSDGQVFLHPIDDDQAQVRKFPMNKSTEPGIVNVAISGDFLLMVDSKGSLKYYLIEDNSVIAE